MSRAESAPRVAPLAGQPLRQLLKRAMTLALPRRAFIAAGPRRSGQVCLTFDDGPDPAHTPALLEALWRHGVRATFFLVGAKAAAHPHLVRRIHLAGHTIGHHSYTHGEPARMSARELWREVTRTSRLLADLTGRTPKLFRPPHGKLTALKLLMLWLERQTVVLWSLDPKDFARRSAAEVGAFFAENPPRSGDLVLLHETNPYAAEVVGPLVAELRARNLETTTVDAWTRP